MYRDFILNYETLILIIIRAHRDKYFHLYVEVLEMLAPLFFALDHVNYSRWLPIHIRDMKSLPHSIKVEFEKQCHWVLSKTNNKFSAIPIDQVHEQENAYVKGSGGCIELTENPVAFRLWMLSGPELARLQWQFEEDISLVQIQSTQEICRTMNRVLLHRKCFKSRLTTLLKLSTE